MNDYTDMPVFETVGSALRLARAAERAADACFAACDDARAARHYRHAARFYRAALMPVAAEKVLDAARACAAWEAR